MELPSKKTLKRWDIPGTARFLTFSCYQRLRLFDNDRIKDRFVEHLINTLARHDMKVLAWVIMPEHVHLIVFSDGDSRVSALLNALKNPFSREVLQRWRTLNAAVLPRLRDRSGDHHFWQMGGRYDRHVVGDELIEKIKYVHTNPVKRGLSLDSVSWKWSSAAAYQGDQPVYGPTIAFDLLPPFSGDLL